MPSEEKTIAEMTCPVPLLAKDMVLLGHGSGGKLSAELIREVFLPALRNPRFMGQSTTSLWAEPGLCS